MNKVFTILLIAVSTATYAQQTGSFQVGGDFEKFYPVTFLDGGWDQNIATELEIGRSAVHYDSDWRGSMIAKFRFHTTQWGNGANFIDADIFQINNRLTVQRVDFVAGYQDATSNNNGYKTIIWLRGGGTTYYFKSNVTTNPTVFDGIQNALPFHEAGGPDHTYKTVIEDYINSSGFSRAGTAYFSGSGKSFFQGNVGIGTNNPTEKLCVNGKIRSKEVLVETTNWPDYVFKPNYKLSDLEDVKAYIDKNQHLPDIPSEKEISEKGLSLGEMNKLLVKKVEELTLYLIENKKLIRNQEERINALEKKLNDAVKPH